MDDERLDGAALEGFAPGARAAVARADTEARELGHPRVGTEHLLLGLLAGDDSVAATVLAEAGVTAPAARRKVSEALGLPERSPALPGRGDRTLPASSRASRAVGRASRFAHQRRAAQVETEHLLLGVLDVEGTAGQVLRGLGVDVDRLRTTLDTADPAALASPPHADALAEVAAVPPRCPSCSHDLDGRLRARTSAAVDPGGAPVDAVVFWCGECGHVLGVSPAGDAAGDR